MQRLPSVKWMRFHSSNPLFFVKDTAGKLRDPFQCVTILKAFIIAVHPMDLG